MQRRPLVANGYIGAWLLLIGTTVVGLGSHWRVLGMEYTPLTTWAADPFDQLGVNYFVYHYAAEAFLDGEDIYTAPPPGWSEFYTFLYPPSTVLIWVPGTVLEPMTGFAVHTAGTAVASLIGAWLIARLLETVSVTIGWLDIVLIGGFFFAGIHSTGTILFGNIDVVLGALIAGGILALFVGRPWIAGAAFGGAALFKLLPTLIGIYLLRIRSWRAIGGAVAVGGGGLASSALLFGPGSVQRFFTDIVLPRSESEAFVGGYAPDDTYYVTIQRPLSHLIWDGLLPRVALWPSAPADLLPVVAGLVLAPVLVYTYIGLDTRLDRLVAVHATLTVVVIWFPSRRFYLAFLFVTWIALLYSWGGGPAEPRRSRVLATAGGGLLGYWVAQTVIWDRWFLVLAVAVAAGVLVYRWYGTAVGATFFIGGVIAVVADRPSDMIARVSAFPAPLDSLLAPVVGIATMQLIGLLVMLGACVGYKYQQGVDLAAITRALQQTPTVIRAEIAGLTNRGERQ